jgi:hypothetical protein
VAFSKRKKHNKSISLVSFMDMIFMLLIFYLVTGYSSKMSHQEKKLFIPTPKNEIGRAQLVIQFIDSDRILLLDQTATGIVSDTEDKMGYLPPEQLNQAILEALIASCTYSTADFEKKLKVLVAVADSSPEAAYFVLIRVPNELPYYLVVNMISNLMNTQYQNIKYGCVGGTIDQLRQASGIRTVLVEDKSGNRRKNLRVDF